jgi:hypothetical protein
MPTIVSLHGRGGAVVPPRDRLLPRLSVCKKVLKRTLPEIAGKKKASGTRVQLCYKAKSSKSPIPMRKLCVFSKPHTNAEALRFFTVCPTDTSGSPLCTRETVHAWLKMQVSVAYARHFNRAAEGRPCAHPQLANAHSHVRSSRVGLNQHVCNFLRFLKLDSLFR